VQLPHNNNRNNNHNAHPKGLSLASWRAKKQRCRRRSGAWPHAMRLPPVPAPLPAAKTQCLASPSPPPARLPAPPSGALRRRPSRQDAGWNKVKTSCGRLGQKMSSGAVLLLPARRQRHSSGRAANDYEGALSSGRAQTHAPSRWWPQRRTIITRQVLLARERAPLGRASASASALLSHPHVLSGGGRAAGEEVCCSRTVRRSRAFCSSTARRA